jgi:hypothetical protein
MNQELLKSKLDLLLPTSLEESNFSKTLDEFLLFIHSLTSWEYKVVLWLLPDMPIFQNLSPIPVVLTIFEIATPRQTFFDIICYNTVIIYIKHVTPYEIIAHLLNRLKVKPGKGLRRLVQMLSTIVRNDLYKQLIEFDNQAGKDRYGIVDEFAATLTLQFEKIRPGFVDFAIAELIKQFENRQNKNRSVNLPADVEVAFEIYILKKIQDKRRKDPSRLPQINTVAEARFALEEVHRELFLYPNPDKQTAIDLLMKVHQWYSNSAIRQKISERPLFWLEGVFFDEVHWTALGLKSNWNYEPIWETYVLRFLASEQFWHNLAGLNKEIPYEYTEAYRNEALYRRSALITPAILLAPFLLPIIIRVTISAPGAIVRLFMWVRGSLLLATQYAFTTYRVYGLAAGTAKIARDAYVYYLNNAIKINEIVLNGAEIVLDITGNENGLAPGSSPADIYSATSQKISQVVKRGVSDLAVEIKTLGPRIEVNLVEFVANLPDSKQVRVTAEVIGEVVGFDNRIKVVVREFSTNLDNFHDSNKKIIFYSLPNQAVDTLTGTKLIPKPSNAIASSAVDVVTSEKVIPYTSISAGKKIGKAEAEERRAFTVSQKAAEKKKIAGKPDKDKERLTDNRGLPKVSKSSQGYLSIDVKYSEGFKALEKAGFKIESIPAKQPNSLGGRWASNVTGTDREWEIITPSGIKAELDGLAVDPSDRSLLNIIEAKASNVESVKFAEQSGHAAFWDGKVKQMTRQLAIVLESNGFINKIIIPTNSRVAAEIYTNLSEQHIAEEFLDRYPHLILAWMKKQGHSDSTQPTLTAAKQIVNRHIEIVESAWAASRSKR